MLYLTNDSQDPAWNQAFEEYVFDHVTGDDVLLIWRNAPAVVCGRFQNAFAEVSVAEAVRRGIPVIRRPSGGGTVYHDLGNVNYTIIRDGSPYDRDYASFISPVTETLRSLGIPANLSGESDIAVDGLKVSGSAQRAAHGRVMHHATLLYSCDLDALRTLTRGRRAWFITKGTASKPAPVTNMRDHMASPFASADDFLHAFTDALTQRFGAHHGVLPGEADGDIARLAREKYASWDWTYGRSPAFTYSRSAEWGKNWPGQGTVPAVRVAYGAKNGVILDASFSPECPLLTERLTGQKLDLDTIARVLSECGIDGTFLPFLLTPSEGYCFMSETLTMPSLRPEMKSGVLAAWLKEPGEAFRKGEPIFEIETDKVVSQIEAVRDGVMGRHLVDEGDEVACGSAIAEIE